MRCDASRSMRAHSVAVLILRDARTPVRVCATSWACALLRTRTSIAYYRAHRAAKPERTGRYPHHQNPANPHQSPDLKRPTEVKFSAGSFAARRHCNDSLGCHCHRRSSSTVCVNALSWVEPPLGSPLRVASAFDPSLFFETEESVLQCCKTEAGPPIQLHVAGGSASSSGQLLFELS